MAEEEQANLERFLKWATDLGVTDSVFPTPSVEPMSTPPCLGHTLAVSHFPGGGGRGLGAARNIRKGELILKVPKAALMTSEGLMMNDYRLSVAVKKHPSLSSTQILGVSLLNEINKGRSSWWYPYIKQLPRSYDILAGFRQFEMQAFQIEHAVWTVEKAKQRAEMEWEEARVVMCELKLKPALLSVRAWLWAFATMSSRTMHIASDEAGCFCPLGDFFNYASPGEEQLDNGNSLNDEEVSGMDITSSGEGHIACTERLIDAGYEENLGAYCFYAKRDYKKGEQVLLSYGTYTNLELLEHYGFLLNENPNDKAFITLEAEMHSLCSWPGGSVYIHQDGKPSFAFLAAVRLWAVPSSKRRSVGHRAHSGQQLSKENEVTTMEWISRRCRTVLAKLPTSAEQDKELISFIDKIEDIIPHMEVDEITQDSKHEFFAFLESNNIMTGQSYADYKFCGKDRRSMHRWKLAIQWRLKYKRTLFYCISYCNEMISTLLPGKTSSVP